MSWFSDYFDDDFVRLYGPFLTPERTWEEAKAVVELLGLPRGARVLDLACGWGRHSVALAAGGMEVVGVDLSDSLLRRAGRLADEVETRAGWVRADLRALPFGRSFDVAVSLFSSLGYFGGDEGDLEALREARRVLRPGGLFLLETMHRDVVAREFVEHDWWEGGAGEHVWVERAFDAVAGVSREWLRWRNGDEQGEKYHEIRIRSATEWGALLRAAGFDPLDWYGGWHREPFDHTSERLVVIARAPG